MKKLKSLLFSRVIIFLMLFAATNVFAQSGKLFTVNDVADTHDANVGDAFCADANGRCTLRAAIEEANAAPALDAVNFALPNPSTIDLTLGQLTISTNIYIIGPGARKLTVERSQNAGTPQFRIFQVPAAAASGFQPTTIRGMTIRNGNSSNDGGAIYTNYGSSLQLTDVWITNNTAAGSAGAIFNAGNLIMTRSLISSNTANGLFAGGIVNINSQGTSLIADSTLTNNVGGQGGAIYNTGNLALANDTISNNSARNTGSSVTNDSTGAVNVLNTIIGMDSSPTVSSLQGAFTSSGNNLITDARNSTGFTNGTNNDQVSDNNAINPLLGNLVNNGGQTNTLALLSGSPAIDHGNNCVFNRSCATPFTNVRLFTDQRENTLRQAGFGTVDVGAFEFNTSTFSSSGIVQFSARPRQIGSLIISTNAATNEKIYRIINPNAGARFITSGRDAYVLEIRSKRAGLSSFIVLDPDGVVPFVLSLNSTAEQDGIKYTYEENSPKK